ncbi:cupin domain-containing protein [Nesterenkonia flava]|uniref:Cupin domain-containing protein n=1 Tax=Nesterenkonia flava TaxID=469799 RepID=A0ABU1FTC7_9MICC|nr:cupin domain-containing protein [Nesterenkonia flava]MDR5711487.1 cupin domain-containing protein [Nesterenkonia flava]
MITVTSRSELTQSDSAPDPTAEPQDGTVLFEGRHHHSGVTFFWADTPPGSGPETHWHPYTETWAVIEGDVEISADGETLQAATGDIVTVTAGTVHRFWNTGAENLRMLCIHASPELIEHEVPQD